MIPLMTLSILRIATKPALMRGSNVQLIIITLLLATTTLLVYKHLSILSASLVTSSKSVIKL